MGKCKRCGEESHNEDEVNHLMKTDLYKIVARQIDLVDRTLYSGEELADLAASYLGRHIVLVERRRHKPGFFSKLVPYMMIHDAYPKPAKFLLPNGIVYWRADRLENKPESAAEYKVKKLLVTIRSKFKCTSCGAEITLAGLEEKQVKCPTCGKRYQTFVEDREMVSVWGSTTPADKEVKMGARPI